MNASFDFQQEALEYLKRQRGPSHLPVEVAIPVTIVYVLIFFTGLLGNIAVCVVIIRHPAMHTATNYYLFNLAISDLTLLIFGESKELLTRVYVSFITSLDKLNELPKLTK